MRNGQNRLQLYYGAEYGLHYVSEKGSGTTVYVRIPTGEGRVNEDSKRRQTKEDPGTFASPSVYRRRTVYKFPSGKTAEGDLCIQDTG